MSEIPPPTVPPATPPPPGGGSYTPPPPPPTGGIGGGPAASSDRGLMIVLSYLWILALIPLIVRKDDAEVQWHAKNGLAITIAEIALQVLLTVLGYFIGNSLGLGCGLSAISCALWIGFLVVRILCIVKGTSGSRFRLPVISDFADKM
jgi:uncharacterized membrane protein